MTDMPTRKRAVPNRVLCKIGTLAHNTQFTPRDFAQYTGADKSVLTRLRKAGYVETPSRGRYFPTQKGWDAIEAACGDESGSSTLGRAGRRRRR